MLEKLKELETLSLKYASALDTDPTTNIVRLLFKYGFCKTHHLKYRLSLKNSADEQILLITVKLNTQKEIAYVKTSYLEFKDGERVYSKQLGETGTKYQDIDKVLSSSVISIINLWSKQLKEA